MAFMKYSYAPIRKVGVSGRQWEEITRKSGRDFSDRTSSVVIQNYSPDRYLLTHSTIICSVDTEQPPGVKTGSIKVGSDTINRKYPDYWIKSATLSGINDNDDSWERNLLLATYKTFIGAENYCEHIQIPELSKGKIIDAVARNLGDHVYVDILTATDRKHAQLIRDIEDGKINAMSMGCSITFSICNKCGNVASEEKDLCTHIRNEKGSKFTREDGQESVVAELCGHVSDPSSVKFIEASWVANPAFKGAVTHNILNVGSFGNASEAGGTEIGKASVVDWTDYFQKSASSKAAQWFQTSNFADRTAFFDGDEDEEGGQTEDDSLSLIDEARQRLKEKVKKKLIQDLEDEIGGETEEERVDMNEAEGRPNENLVQSFTRFKNQYGDSLGNRVASTYQAYISMEDNNFLRQKGRFDNRDIVSALYLRQASLDPSVPHADLYPCVLRAGGVANYKNVQRFLTSCQKIAGRKITAEEAQFLVRVGRFLN